MNQLKKTEQYNIGQEKRKLLSNEELWKRIERVHINSNDEQKMELVEQPANQRPVN